MADDADLAEFEQRLASIDAALATGGLTEEEVTELTSLRAQLQEFIALAADQQQPTSSSALVDNDEVLGSDERLVAFVESLLGEKCRAPYGERFGHRMPIKYHNAVVFSIVDDENQELVDLRSLRLSVLYTNPLFRAMKPCPYFLDDRCSYGDNCKFSHGEVVLLGELLEYLEPDFENMKLGVCCLAMDGELWRLARITAVDYEAGQVAIKWLDTGVDSAVDLEKVLVLDEEEQQHAIGEGADVSGTCSNEIESSLMTEDGHGDIMTNLPRAPMGGWERHTKGIGSRLLAKMGYEPGKGLGKASDGIVDPVQATRIPKGKSLDYVMEMKESGDVDRLEKRRECRRLKRLQKLNSEQQKKNLKRNPNEASIFAFINRRMSHIGKKPLTKSAVAKALVDEGRRVKQESSRNLGVLLLEFEQKEKTARKRLVDLKASLARNESRDPIYADQCRRKIAAVESELRDLTAKQSRVQGEQQSRNEKKKSTIF